MCLAIPANVIDHDLARGLDDAVPGRQGSTERQPSGLQVLVSSRPLLIFAVCAVLFHLANAAMLPLVGQKLALPDKNLGTSLMAACIVVAQLVMVPMAMLVGATADRLGRKPLFLAGLLVLPIRGDNPYWLVSVQHLDGIGAGVYCDLSYHRSRHHARHRAVQRCPGVVMTAQGIGAALSTALAGVVVHAVTAWRSSHSAA